MYVCVYIYLFTNRLKAAINTQDQYKMYINQKHLKTTVLHRSTVSLSKAMQFNCGLYCETLRALDSKVLHVLYSGPRGSLVHLHLNQRRIEAVVTLYCHFTELRLVETSKI